MAAAGASPVTPLGAEDGAPAVGGPALHGKRLGGKQQAAAQPSRLRPDELGASCIPAVFRDRGACWTAMLQTPDAGTQRCAAEWHKNELGRVRLRVLRGLR